jgi:hypothetical protein
VVRSFVGASNPSIIKMHLIVINLKGKFILCFISARVPGTLVLNHLVIAERFHVTDYCCCQIVI